MMSQNYDSDFEIDEDFLRDAFGEKAEQSVEFTNTITNEKNSAASSCAYFVNHLLPPKTKDENISISCSMKEKDHLNRILTDTAYSGSSNSFCLEAEPVVEPVASSSTLFGSRNLRDTKLLPSARAIAKKSSVRRRKFPGPAGLLPDKVSDRGLEGFFLNDSKHEASATFHGEDAACSQSSNDEIDNLPWHQLMNDFDLSEPSRLSCYNVLWIKRRASARLLVGRKVPFLAIVIKSIDFYSTDPSVVLQDKTGEINGTLHREFLEKYPNHLKPGTVLVLHRLGVVSTGFPVKRHYLNITLNNLISIYDMDDVAESGKVRVTSVKNLSITEIINDIDRSEAQNLNTSTLVDKTNVQQNTCNTLFSGPLTSSTNLGLKAGSISAIPHGNTHSGNHSALKNFGGHGKSDRGPFANLSSAKSTNIAIPLSPSRRGASTFQSFNPNANGNETELRSKVARISEPLSCGPCVASSDTHPPKHLEAAHARADADVVDSIFQGFDCSSLFEDF